MQTYRLKDLEKEPFSEGREKTNLSSVWKLSVKWVFLFTISLGSKYWGIIDPKILVLKILKTNFMKISD